MFFSKEDLEKIKNWLVKNSVKDSQLPKGGIPLDGSEELPILQKGKNVKLNFLNVIDSTLALRASDIINVNNIPGFEGAHTLQQVVESIITSNRRKGLIVTFLNTENDWSLYQFQGNSINNWNDLHEWVNLEGGEFKGMAFPNTKPDNIKNKTLYYLTNTEGTYTEFDNAKVEKGISMLIKTYNASKWAVIPLMILTDELGGGKDKVVSQEAITKALIKKVDKNEIKTVNGKSILGSGNVECGVGRIDSNSVNKTGEIFNAIGEDGTAIKNKATGAYSHSEGYNTEVTSNYGHAEGFGNKVYGESAHAEGNNNTANGLNSHVEGDSNVSNGNNSHTEGDRNRTEGENSHTEGINNTNSGLSCHIEGNTNNARNCKYSHAEGSENNLNADYAHIEGKNNLAEGEGSHIEGSNNKTKGQLSHAEGYNNNCVGNNSHAEGFNNISNGCNGHTEGSNNITVGNASHAEGFYNTSNGDFSHTEGKQTTADGEASHAEGYYTSASGRNSHAEGDSSNATGDASHAEGSNNTGGGAFGDYSHVEGLNNLADGTAAHAEGQLTGAIGNFSHAEGNNSEAYGNCSHAGGNSTLAGYFAETTIGQYNINEYPSNVGGYDATKPLFVVGNGTSDTLRSDALRLSGEGKLWIQGVGDYIGTNPSADNSLQSVLKTITTVDFSDYYNKKAVDDKLQGKQDTLIGKEIEGQNIKTINGLDITGKGNIQIEGGGGSSTPIIDSLDSTSTTAALSANQGRVLNEDKVSQQQFIAYQGQVSGELDNRALHSEIPVNISQLTNDTGYITQNEIDKKASISYVDTKDTLLNTKIDTSNVSRFFGIVTTTPDNYRAASTEKGKVYFDTRTKAFVWESGGYYYKNGTNSSSYNNDSGGALKDKLFMFKDTDDLDELYTYNAASGLAKVKTIDTTNIISSDTTNKIPTSQAVLSYVSNKLYKSISGGSFDVFGNVEDSGVYTIINNDSMPLGTLNVYCSFGNTFIIQTLISVFDLDEQGHLIHNPQYKKHPSIVSRMKRLIANSEKPSIPVGVWTPWEYISTPEIVNKADKQYVANLVETLVDKNTFNEEIDDLNFDIASKESISKTNKYLTQPFDSIDAVSNVKNESTLDVNARVIFNTLSKKFVWKSGFEYYSSHPNNAYYNDGDTICKNKLYLSKGKIYVYDERAGLKEFKVSIKTINGISLEGSGNIITIGKPGLTVTGEVFNDYTNNAAQGNYSHAEGNTTLARGDFSHVEGKNNASVGAYSHAGGRESVTRGDYSFAHGYSVAANNYGQTTFGINSISDAESASPNGFNKDKPLFLIGNGEDSSNRSNALLMNGYGTTWIEGIGDYDGTNPNANNSLQNIIKNAASGSIPKKQFTEFVQGIDPEKTSHPFNKDTDSIVYDVVKKIFIIKRYVNGSATYYNWDIILNDYITGVNPGVDRVKSNVIFERINPITGEGIDLYVYNNNIKGLANIDGSLINADKIGTTNGRPNPLFIYPGFRYFDTDLNEPIYLTKDNKWVNANGGAAGEIHSGVTLTRPASAKDGFTYFDTTVNKLLIKLGAKWVDSNGVVVP